MDGQLISKVIQRKRKALRTFTIEQAAIAGFIGGLVGLVLGGLYTIVLGGIIWHIANVFLYAIIGAVIGYFSSKSKKEDLQVELMILESFKNDQLLKWHAKERVLDISINKVNFEWYLNRIDVSNIYHNQTIEQRTLKFFIQS